MKTRSLTNLSLALALSALPFLGGCTPSNATDAESALNNVPPPAVTSAGDQSAVPAAPETDAATPVPHPDPVLPPHILPATPLADVVKLAQAGVGESVMLTFITNATKPFDLGSEEIVYLNDIGVSDSVITTMMQHDQGLRPSGSNLGQAPAPQPEPVAAPEPAPVAVAPSYVAAPTAAPAAEGQPTYVSNNYFYDSLAPYGNWIEVEGYGRCWQPTVVVANRNWQPYGDHGRWVYTDAGWYWLSDYSWGATTFHYGRWFTTPSRGWCWWPDTVWAPSWVSWRYSGSYCGWAPLPPAAYYQPGFGFSFNGSSVGFGFSFGLGVSAYTFVPWGGFCAARPYQYRVPAHQAVQVYNNSTVINNYVSGNNNTVINNGISPDRVRQYTRTEVRTVRLRDQAAGDPRNERLARDGRTLAVHRPQLTPVNGNGVVPVGAPARTGSPRANGPTLTGTPQNAGRNSVARNGRSEVGVERSRVNGTSSSVRVPSPVPSDPSATAVSRSPATAPAFTPKGNQPRVIQVTPQNASRPTAAPAGSLVVIGGKNATRSGGRDYSVWSTPRPDPTASAPAGSPRIGAPSRSAPSPIVSSPPVTARAPASPSRTWADGEVASRDSYPTFSTPSPRASNFTPRPEAVRPAPSFTPRPASPSPTPGSPRFESRSAPAPATPSMAPARPPSGPASSPGPRSR